MGGNSPSPRHRRAAVAETNYIALFYSHFGATRYSRLLTNAGWENRMCPVPRSLSSSCGTCVRYAGPAPCPTPDIPEEVEKIVEVREGASSRYTTVYEFED